jgi:uncharacterized protein
MEFEWDEDKNRSNIAKHGIDFALAVQIFERPTVDRIDDREAYGEERTISIGMIAEGAIVVVVYTDRSGRIRIISARSALRWERRFYEEEI